MPYKVFIVDNARFNKMPGSTNYNDDVHVKDTLHRFGSALWSVRYRIMCYETFSTLRLNPEFPVLVKTVNGNNKQN